MKVKIGPAGRVEVTAEGLSKKEVVKDLQAAITFVEEGLDVVVEKKKTRKKPVRKPKAKKVMESPKTLTSVAPPTPSESMVSN